MKHPMRKLWSHPKRLDSMYLSAFFDSAAHGWIFGLPPNLTDPFEKSTVFVRPSTLEGAGQGLFVRRAVRAGHLISFYSGLMLDCDKGNGRSSLDRRVEGEDDKHKRNRNSLFFMDMTNPDKKFDVCVFVPQEYSSLDQYSATLGHKANHDIEANAR